MSSCPPPRPPQWPSPFSRGRVKASLPAATIEASPPGRPNRPSPAYPTNSYRCRRDRVSQQGPPKPRLGMPDATAAIDMVTASFKGTTAGTPPPPACRLREEGTGHLQPVRTRHLPERRDKESVAYGCRPCCRPIALCPKPRPNENRLKTPLLRLDSGEPASVRIARKSHDNEGWVH